MSNDLNSTIQEFRDAMFDQGIDYSGEIEADGKLHRVFVEGDKRGSLNGWYILHFDEKPAGMFGCNKRHGDHKFNWQSSQKTKPWSAEEKAAYAAKVAKERAQKDAAQRARREAAAAAANEIWNAAVEAGNNHPYLQAKGVKAHGLRIGKWEKINQDTGEVRLISDMALLVPICDRTRKIHSLQGIFPNDKNALRRNKDYFADGEKSGMFHTIGSKPQQHNGQPVFVLCEGYATGASIHECTNHLLLVTFDTSNLLHVAKAIRERVPQAIIVLAADNDQWTTQPVSNPGVHYATAAAAAVGGFVAVPQFIDLEGQPTDFNDLHQREGADVVEAVFHDLLNAPPAATDDSPPWEPEPMDESLSDQEEQGPAPAPSEPMSDYSEPEDDEFEDELVKNAYFTILGYDGATYYLFHHEKRQVIDITKSDLSDVGLIELAPINWWEEHFPGAKEGMDKKAAANWLFRTANSRGIYDPTRVRGRGAWKDKDRYVFHHGDRLTVDGKPTDITKIASAYVYPMGRKMPDPEEMMLTAEEGRHLLEVAKMVRWSQPASAALMAGWTMLAPICGALKWRPHIWLTGAAGSGKSTIQRAFCCALTAGINVYAQGNSTEPGIRQTLRADALPVLLDEAESNNEAEVKRVESILAMIRQSSSESQAKTLKGTISGSSMNFNIRSMFCLASVNTNLDKKADVDRLTKLVIRSPATDGSGEEHWRKLEDELHRIEGDETISARLLARALILMPIIHQNVTVFGRAAAKFFGSQREGDQFGTMIAGAWSLTNDTVATEEQAKAMIESFTWKEHVEDHDQNDAQIALEAVLSAKIRMGAAGDLSVHELIRETTTLHGNGIVGAKEADAALRRHGIRVELKTNQLLFGTSVSNLKKLVERSSFVTDLRGQLLRLPDATRYQDKAMRFNGLNSKCVSIVLGTLLDDSNDGYEDDGSPL